MGGGVDPLFLCLFRGLPEKAIGRDRGAEHGDDRDNVIPLPAEARDENAIADLGPGYVDHQRGRDISE
jgi:hypothetical protein